MLDQMPNLILSADAGLWALVMGTGWVVRGVLLLLVCMSVGSWAIIIYKARQLKRIHHTSKRFQDYFWETRRLDQILATCEQFEPSPLVALFRAGYKELGLVRDRRSEITGEVGKRSDLGAEDDLESIERAMRKAHTKEMTVAESLISFLATVGSSTPFIGLFGTVWGIMDSFQQIGVTQNASLATVAPGISEALVATATGLAAAIPAVIAYNYFIERVKHIDNEMENFSRDFLNIVKRLFIR